MRIIVTGSRHADVADPAHRLVVSNALSSAERDGGYVTTGMTLVHGAATGIDSIARDIATSWGWAAEGHPARWDECGDGCPPRPHLRRRRDGRMYCPHAGPRRNEEMCQLGADIVIAFPGPDSTGTWDCLKRAAAHGIRGRVEPLRRPVERKAGQR